MRLNNTNIAFQGKQPDNVFSKVGEAAVKNKNNKFLNKILNYDTLDYATKNINVPMYAWMLMLVVIGSRYIQARDKDEKREILTRDFIGLSGYLFAMPIFSKITAALIEKNTGFLTSFKKGINDIKENIPENKKGLWESVKGYILKGKGHQLLSYNDIKNTYINNEKMSDFAELIKKNTSDSGNQLYKILSFALGKDGKAQITTEDTSNAGMKKWIEGLEKTDSPILNKLKTEFGEKGSVLRKAELLKTVPDLAVLAFTVGMLGWFLPWFNIHYTRALYKSGKNNPDAKPSTQQTLSDQQVQNTQSVTTNLTMSQNNLFSEFVK